MEERSDTSCGGRVVNGPEMLESGPGRQGSGGDDAPLGNGAAWALFCDASGWASSFWELGEGVP